MTDLAEVLITQQEGRKACAYPDSRGYLTIGIGCCVDKEVAGAGLCDAAIEAQFAFDRSQATAIAQRIPHFADVNDVQQAALISMAFQLGDQILRWPDFMSAMGASDYADAAAAGLDSAWARETPTRAALEMAMLKTGAWAQNT